MTKRIRGTFEVVLQITVESEATPETSTQGGARICDVVGQLRDLARVRIGEPVNSRYVAIDCTGLEWCDGDDG